MSGGKWGEMRRTFNNQYAANGGPFNTWPIPLRITSMLNDTVYDMWDVTALHDTPPTPLICFWQSEMGSMQEPCSPSPLQSQPDSIKAKIFIGTQRIIASDWTDIPSFCALCNYEPFAAVSALRAFEWLQNSLERFQRWTWWQYLIQHNCAVYEAGRSQAPKCGRRQWHSSVSWLWPSYFPKGGHHCRGKNKSSASTSTPP